MQKLGAGEIVGQVWHLPVCYDPRFAIDLDDVAKRTSLSTQQVVERHSGPIYHVYMLGFLRARPIWAKLPPSWRSID